MPAKLRPLLATALLAALAAPAAAMPLPAGSDPGVRPQDDLFRAVNGKWLDNTPIPGDKKSYGSFMILREKSNVDVRALVQAAARRPGGDPERQLVGNLYAALTDEKAIEKAGLTALAEQMRAIDTASSLEDIATMMASLETDGVAMPVRIGVGPDAKHPNINAVYWGQGGLTMPNRDYYIKKTPENEKLHKAYMTYLQRLNELAGPGFLYQNGEKGPGHAADDAKAVADIEQAIAEAQWSSAERRDAVKTYNPVARKDLAKSLGAFPWERLAEGSDMPKRLGVIVSEPSYLKALSTFAPKFTVEQWQAYLRTRVLDTFAPHLPRAFRQASFEFHGKQLQGLQAPPPRWRTAVETTDDLIGEAVGRQYVAKYFPPTAKAHMQVLVGNLLASYRDALGKLPWMAPATRTEALAKLAKLRVKIGYPDKWRGYAGLALGRDNAARDVLVANRFLSERDMAEAGKPVDKSRWDMSPQTVNAYYNPVGNEIVFPAAILQDPFFSTKRDDAYNYGAIGAVIGHETSHGFDDQGRRYDADGKLRDWWTPADAKNFMARADRLAAQYGKYEPLPGQHVDGKLTLGENIADLAGLTMALEAYHRSLHGQQPKVVDGLTSEQRFFVGYARVWRGKSRPEYLHMRLVADPHSPEQFRTNGVVTNMDAFYQAFGLKPGDRLYKKPEDRVHIW